MWSVKCEVWSVKEAVGSEKCEVWSVECEVSSLECEKCSVKCGVWSVKTLLRLSLEKSNGCRGKDTVGTGCLWTIGHLCLGNFRRRLARVYVIVTIWRVPRQLINHGLLIRGCLYWRCFKRAVEMHSICGSKRKECVDVQSANTTSVQGEQSWNLHSQNKKKGKGSFWVNYNISLTWIVRPFGDDFPY